MSLTSDLMSLCFTSSRKNIFPLFSSLSFLVLKFAFKCDFFVWCMCMCGMCVCAVRVYVSVVTVGLCV